MSSDGGHGARSPGTDAAAPAGQAAEAAHMIGSAVVTGGVAAVLVLAAIPVSIGLGMAWGLRALRGKAGGRAR